MSALFAAVLATAASFSAVAGQECGNLIKSITFEGCGSCEMPDCSLDPFVNVVNSSFTAVLAALETGSRLRKSSLTKTLRHIHTWMAFTVMAVPGEQPTSEPMLSRRVARVCLK
jgi:hypothetical protein